MRKAMLIILAMCVVACSPSEADKTTAEAKKPVDPTEQLLAEAKNTVLASLKDPDSAKFGQFTIENEKFACLDVNAKNSFGGYTGMQSATLLRENGKWVSLGIDKYGHNFCVELIKRMAQEKLESKQPEFRDTYSASSRPR